MNLCYFNNFYNKNLDFELTDAQKRVVKEIRADIGSGKQMNLYGVAQEIGRRLSSIFLKDEQGKRPVHGTSKKFQEDPHWKDYPMLYEYFHGDTGAGVGASHQTGWTAAIARIMHLFAAADSQMLLDQGKAKAVDIKSKSRGMK